MGHRVIARFFHRASGCYIDPGQECPPLPVEDAKRLVRARCLVEVPGGQGPPSGGRGPSPDAPPASPPSRKSRSPRSETPQPPEE